MSDKKCNSLRQRGCSLILASLSLAMSTFSWADCSYTITSNWGSGFTGEIKVTNNTNQTVNGWSVNRKDSATITSSWNATLSGSNPYTATALSWNSTLAPNASASFGFQGAGTASIATVSGSLCGAAISSSSKSSATVSSVAPSSKPASSIAPSSKAASSSSAVNNYSLVLQEAQTGFCSVDGSIDSDNSGFTGTGFVNTENAQGKTVKWAINAANSGRYTLTFRFASGGTSNGSLVINGGSNGNYTFELPGTGSWTSWQTASIEVDLVQGNNLVQLSAMTADGLPNIDSLTIVGEQATPGSCGAVSSTPKSSSSAPSSSSNSSNGNTSTTPDCNSISTQPIITVAADGSGQYKTLKAAMESLSTSNSKPTQIRVKPGTYNEKITFDRPNVTVCGQAGKAAQTLITHDEQGTSTGFTIKITANDVSFENMTLQNRHAVSQAPALMTTGNRIQFRNSRILGLQDTLYAHSGTQYYRNVYIEGRVDYIFGAATAVFENCEMRTMEAGSAVAAPSTLPAVKWGLIFLGGKLTADPKIKAGSQWLARSWGAEGFTAFIRVELGAHIKGEGWGVMSKNEGKLNQARFYEYKSTGPGANPGARAKEVAPQLSDAEAAKYTIANIFGSWIPSFSK